MAANFVGNYMVENFQDIPTSEDKIRNVNNMTMPHLRLTQLNNKCLWLSDIYHSACTILK